MARRRRFEDYQAQDAPAVTSAAPALEAEPPASARQSADYGRLAGAVPSGRLSGQQAGLLAQRLGNRRFGGMVSARAPASIRITARAEFAELQSIALSGQRSMSAGMKIAPAASIPSSPAQTAALKVATASLVNVSSGAATIPSEKRTRSGAEDAKSDKENGPAGTTAQVSTQGAKNEGKPEQGVAVEQERYGMVVPKARRPKRKPNRARVAARQRQAEREGTNAIGALARLVLQLTTGKSPPEKKMPGVGQCRASAEAAGRKADSQATPGSRQEDLDRVASYPPEVTIAPETPAEQRAASQQIIRNLWKTIVSVLKTGLGSAASMAQNIGSQLGSIFGQVAQPGFDAVKATLAQVMAVVRQAAGSALETLSRASSTIGVLLSRAHSGIGQLLDLLPGPAASAVEWLRSEIGNLKRQAVRFVLNLLRGIRLRVIAMLNEQIETTLHVVRVVNEKARAQIMQLTALEVSKMMERRSQVAGYIRTALDIANLSPAVRMQTQMTMLTFVWQFMHGHAEKTAAEMRATAMVGSEGLKEGVSQTRLDYEMTGKQVETTLSPIITALNELVPGASAALSQGVDESLVLANKMFAEAYRSWEATNQVMEGSHQMLVTTSFLFLSM